jgi:hypothetical protein
LFQNVRLLSCATDFFATEQSLQQVSQDGTKQEEDFK